MLMRANEKADRRRCSIPFVLLFIRPVLPNVFLN